MNDKVNLELKSVELVNFPFLQIYNNEKIASIKATNVMGGNTNISRRSLLSQRTVFSYTDVSLKRLGGGGPAVVLILLGDSKN